MAKQVGSGNFSVHETQKLRELARAGISMSEAARRLHRHHATVIRHASELGLEWRRPQPAPKAAKPSKGPVGRRWTEAEDARLSSSWRRVRPSTEPPKTSTGRLRWSGARRKG